MPDCEYFEELCSASLDGELSRAQKRELDAHLAACPACAAYLEDLKLLRTAWGDLKEPLPNELHEKIMGGVLEEAQKKAKPLEKKKRRPPVFTMIAAAAACVMLVMSGAVGDLLGGWEAKDASRKAGDTAADGAAMEEIPETRQALQDELQAPAASPDVEPSTLLPAQDVQPQPEPETREEQNASPEPEPGQAPAEASAPDDAAAPPEDGVRAIAPYSVGATAPQESDAKANKAEKQSVTLPDDLRTRRFALCYVAVGSGDPLLLKDATLLEKIDNVYYFEVRGGMSAVEEAVQVLQEGGFETAVRRDIGVTINENAESTLLVLVVEE